VSDTSQGDITDEQITAAYEAHLEHDAIDSYERVAATYPSVVGLVRALLARQAAVHATRIAELSEQLSAAVECYDELQTVAGGLHARITQLEADIRTGETAMRIVQAESVKAQARAEAAEATVNRQAAAVDRVFASFDADLRRWQNEGGIRYSAFTDLRRQVAAALDGDA
jgi:hypothetical protein